MQPVLATEKLGFSYPAVGLFAKRDAGFRALDEVSIAVAPGKVLGIVGESGSGKSTLLRTIVGLNRADAGTIRFRASEVDHRAGGQELAGFRAGVQMIFQDPGGSLNPFQTIRTMFSRFFALFPTPVPAHERVLGLLAQVGLDESALDRRPSEFSGGQLQRLAIARALACDPAVLLCDEPTSALDVSIQAQILELFLQLKQQGRAFVFVTHNLGVLGQIADDIAVMHRGRVIESGSAREIIRSPRDAYTAALISASPRLDRRGSMLEGARQRAGRAVAADATPTGAAA